MNSTTRTTTQGKAWAPWLAACPSRSRPTIAQTVKKTMSRWPRLLTSLRFSDRASSVVCSTGAAGVAMGSSGSDAEHLDATPCAPRCLDDALLADERVQRGRAALHDGRVQPAQAPGDLALEPLACGGGQVGAGLGQQRAAVCAASLHVPAGCQPQCDLLGLAGAGCEQLGEGTGGDRRLTFGGLAQKQERVELHRTQVDVARRLQDGAVEGAKEPQPRRYTGGCRRRSVVGGSNKREPDGAAAGGVGRTHVAASSPTDRFRALAVLW